MSLPRTINTRLQSFNHQTQEYDDGPAENTYEAHLPYIGERNAEAIFGILVNHQGYDAGYAFIHVLSLVVGEDYPLSEKHLAVNVVNGIAVEGGKGNKIMRLLNRLVERGQKLRKTDFSDSKEWNPETGREE